MAKATFTARQAQSQLNRFFKTELGDLQDAAGVAVKAVANKHVSLMKAETKKAFKGSDHPASKQFFQAFKAYHLAPEGTLGHASFVRAGVPFMNIFQDGGTITPKRKQYLVVRLPGAIALKLPRISKNNRLRRVFERLTAKYGKHSVFRRGDTYFLKREGELIPIYKLQRQVNLGKRIHFQETADQVAKEIPEIIKRLTKT